MVQIMINLDEEQNRFLNIFKAENSIGSKNEALNRILKEYNEILKKQKEDEIFENRIRESLAEYEKSGVKRKLTKKEFLEELESW